MPRLKTRTLTEFAERLDNNQTPDNNFHALYGGLALVPYNMLGAQQATTTIQTPTGPLVFRTTDNKHSEMMALEYMLDQGHWVVLHGQIELAGVGGAVPAAQFTTTQPHCGFCTSALTLLNLPLSGPPGGPTNGNYNLAGNFNYPLAGGLPTNPEVLARFWDQATVAAHLAAGDPLATATSRVVKQILNHMLNHAPGAWVLQVGTQFYTDAANIPAAPPTSVVFNWDDLMQQKHAYLTAIWRRIWEALYAENQ